MKILLASFILLFVVAFSLQQITHGIPGNVAAALYRSGQNKNELLEVINHYKKQSDKRKLKAAYFLVSNMVNMYHHEGPGVRAYRKVFLLMDSIARSGYKNVGHAWDSLQNIYSPFKIGAADTIRDIVTVKADMLIRHIDAAFTAWNYPWARQLSFHDFCEYILPYKLVNEEPETWNSRIQASNQWLSKPAYAAADAREICLLLNKQLQKNFYIGAFRCLWDVNFTDLSMLKAASCYHATQLTAYYMRAMGIPVAMDYTPYWANKSGGHEWNALLEGKKPVPFVGTESDPGKTKVEFAFQRKRAKIFRHMYSIQKKSLAMLVKDVSQIPFPFRSCYMADVTSQYEPVSDVPITLNDPLPEEQFAYLCVYNEKNWRPIWWGTINKEKKVVFKDMGRGIVYAPMYYQGGEFVAAGPPLIVNRKGSIETLSPDTRTKTAVTIYRKFSNGTKITSGKEYELFHWDDGWRSLGKKTAKADSIVYNNVPPHALLIVKNPDQAGLERIFIYKDGKQVWY